MKSSGFHDHAIAPLANSMPLVLNHLRKQDAPASISHDFDRPPAERIFFSFSILLFLAGGLEMLATAAL
jgi:hypothetical protein